MPAPGQPANLQEWQDLESSLRAFPWSRPEPLRACQDSLPPACDLLLCRSNGCLLGAGRFDLNKWIEGVNRHYRLVEQTQRGWVFVLAGECSPRRAPQSAQ